MKRMNGKYYRKFRSSMGRTYWIEMSLEEVFAQDLYKALIVLTPITMILVFAWAAGIFRT